MNHFEFGSPEWLWLIAAAPIILLLYWALLVWQRRKLQRMGNTSTLKELMPNRSIARGWIKISLFALAILFIGLAAARPRTGSKLRSIERKGREIVFVVDVSRSMLAEDIAPSRIECAHHSILQLVERMSQDGVGVVAFAEQAEVLLPITSDYKTAASKVRMLNTNLIAAQGTNLANAIRTATLSFSSSSQQNRSRVMILITDGEDHNEGAVEAARIAAENGITICAIGIGTPEGVILEIDGKPVEDEEGKMVLTKLNEAILQEVTETSQGIYRRAYNGDFGLNKIIERLDEIEESSLTTSRYEEYDEKYQWFLGVALLLLTAESLILSRRNPLLRNVKLFDRDEDNTMEHNKTNKR